MGRYTGRGNQRNRKTSFLRRARKRGEKKTHTVSGHEKVCTYRDSKGNRIVSRQVLSQ